MIRSLWTAATGMNAQSFEQDVIANNLANVNTVGFKRSRVDFQDLMYQVGSKSGTEVRLPLPASQNLEAGMHSVVYELTIPADVTGWARLHITQPAQAFSHQVDFALTCG